MIEIPGPGPHDPGGKRLAAVINAQRRADDWAARRALCGRAVILLSAAMAYIIVKRLGLAGPGARFILTLWSLSFASLVGCFGASWQAERQVNALVAAAGGRRVGG